MSKYGRVGKLVKKLYKRGYLRSRHYFVVIEWQQNGWPHWHVLVDSSFIPFGVIVELWSANRPKWAPKIRKCTAENYQEFDRPAFGSVRFSFRDGGVAEDAIAAAWYAAGYLVKVPEYGFPEWVLHYRGNIKRFSHSQGFFKRAGKCEQPCFCPECLERLESGTEFVEELPQRNPIPEQSNPTLSAVDGRKRLPRTIADRIRDCRSRSVIMEREIWRDEQGADFVGAVRFVQGLNLSYENVLKCFNAEFERPHEIVLTDEWEEHRLRVEAGLPGLEIWEPF